MIKVIIFISNSRGDLSIARLQFVNYDGDVNARIKNYVSDCYGEDVIYVWEIEE
jgi:hypothetical protein